jgi:inner membrane protein
MENQTEKKSLVEWVRESVIIKMGLIGFLTLVLLVPSVLIQELISERQGRRDEVVTEVSDKWAGIQLLQGPVLVLPFRNLVSEKDKDGKVTSRETLSHFYLLPETLNVEAEAGPQILHRGIFDAVVYDTRVKTHGKFRSPDFKKAGIDPAAVLWQNARIVIGLSDLKGLKNNPEIKLGNSSYSVEPDFSSVNLFRHNLVVLADLSAEKDAGFDFSFDMDLRGSSELNFMHLGKNTLVKVGGKWNNPSFTGRYLPEERTISDTNFKATWSMPYFKRPFPQQWSDTEVVFNDKLVEDATFGVKFILPVDQYQKTMRSAKYAILIVLLTFISLFFTEILRKKSIHMFQYVLIGAAMIIYYTLLLSFTEQVGFNLAYIIASGATTALISIFIASVMKDRKIAVLFAGILIFFYTFIFVIIQLQDLALLFGSVGLFITIALLMYFSGKIQWGNK